MPIVVLILFFSFPAFSQYEDYQSYETFSDLDKYERDYGLIFTPGLMYSNVDENNQVAVAPVNNRTRGLLFYDARLGYVFRSGFFFGILYAGETQDINSGGTKTSRESVGMSLGYIKWGWAFTGTFFPYSKQEILIPGNTDVATYSEGLGFQVDAAYYFRLGRYFSVGPQFVYKSLRYGKAESATTSVNANASSQHSVFTPMISMIINLYRG